MAHAKGALDGEEIERSLKDEFKFSPFTVVKPFSEVDETQVQFVLSFTCPFCKEWHPVMHNWSKGLPPSLSFVDFPAVYDKTSMVGATAFYAYQKAVNYDAKKVYDFVEQAFYLIQEKGMSPLAGETWQKASGGILTKELAESVRASVAAALDKTKHYKIQNTPSVIFGGRYMTSPAMTGPSPDNFLQACNGLASMLLINLGQGRA